MANNPNATTTAPLDQATTASDTEETAILDPEEGIGFTYGAFARKYGVHVSDVSSNRQLVCVPPIFAPLIFDNNASDARDHCANERTFLSWLRMSVYLAVVSVAITTTFHLQSQPTKLEKQMAVPMGILFWILSLGSLVAGLSNYLRTVERYSRRHALVQSGLKTQILVIFLSVAIMVACIVLLISDQERLKDPFEARSPQPVIHIT